MDRNKGPELPRHIGVLLMPNFSMLGLFGIIEPIRLANQLLGKCHYRWETFSSDGAPVRASCGMTVNSMARTDAESSPPCMIILSGYDPWPQNDYRLKGWLRALERRGTIFGAVDTGAFLLASAGLLNGVRTALHWESAAAFAELFPDVPTSDQLYELHSRRWLCAGGSAAIDMMLDLLEREHGAGLCAGIETRLNHERRRQKRAAVQVSWSSPCESHIANALLVMEEHIEEPISIAEISEAVSVSQRSLERKCRSTFGRTPTQLYLDVRLERAHRILRHSDMTVREVALSCGFVSVPYFCRAYKARYKVPPGSDRKLDEALIQGSTTNSGKLSADLGNAATGLVIPSRPTAAGIG